MDEPVETGPDQAAAPDTASSYEWLQLKWDGASVPECLATDAKTFAGRGCDARAVGCVPGGNFPKEVHFSPDDGTSILVSTEDAKVHVYNLPIDRIEDVYGDEMPERRHASFEPALTVVEGEPVYTCDWMPGGFHSFLTATRGRPVHLWDSMDGRLCASYCCYNDKDEPTAALCARFDRDPGSSRVVMGLERRIAVFDAHRPGRHDVLFDVSTSSGRSGQRGIISCIDTSGTGSGTLAAGSYDRTIGMYDMRAGCAAQLVIYDAHAGGLTHLQFSRCGNFLYSGARMDAFIHCWDARNMSGSVYSLPRESGGTNQRIGFDIEPCGRHLLSGGKRGVQVYDLMTGERVARWAAWGSSAVGSVNIHPQLPLVVTASGERRFASHEDDERESAAAKRRRVMDNSDVSVWSLDYVYGALDAAQPE